MQTTFCKCQDYDNFVIIVSSIMFVKLDCRLNNYKLIPDLSDKDCIKNSLYLILINFL